MATNNGRGFKIGDNFQATVNPTFTFFEDGSGDKEFAILHINFVNYNPDDPDPIVQAMFALSSTEFTLAPSWYIKTTMTSKKSLMRSSTTSDQEIVYVSSYYTMERDAALQAHISPHSKVIPLDSESFSKN
jgi:hypothetical protein